MLVAPHLHRVKVYVTLCNASTSDTQQTKKKPHKLNWIKIAAEDSDFDRKCTKTSVNGD